MLSYFKLVYDNLEVDMLTVHQLAKSFALNSLFSNVTFSIKFGDRLGLVGPNGCGKTTLLRIIAGLEAADSGHVGYSSGTRIGYLPQGFEIDTGLPFGEIIGRASGDVATLDKEIADLAQALAVRPDDESLQGQYDTLLRRISAPNISHSARILSGLGLDIIPLETPVSHLSGGQQTRLNLALVLLEEPQLLLLDEPTNHLDIEMLEWLEEWLSEFQGGALVVSHDRTFLDRTVSRILHLDSKKRTVVEYAGNYTDFAEQVNQELQNQLAAFHDQQGEIRRIRQDIVRVKAQAAHTERQASSVRLGGEMMKLKGYKDYQQSIAKKVAKKAKSRERKLDRYLDSEERVEKPRQGRTIRLDFSQTDHLGRSVISLEDLSVGYIHEAPLLAGLRIEAKVGDRIALTGPNGSGKTTLLRTIAGQLQPLFGSTRIGPSVNLGFMTQDQTGLEPGLTPLKTVQHAFHNETEARKFLGFFLFTGDEPLLQNSRLSYGQRARLALAKLVLAGSNVLLLDEPINHLDIPGREKFEAALRHFPGTVLAVIHDRYFIDRFASEIWKVENRAIRRIICR